MTTLALSEARPKLTARAVAWCVAVVTLGLLAWPLLGPPFSSTFAAVANATIGALELGQGGHVSFDAETEAEAGDVSAERDGSWGVGAELRIDGVERRHRVRVNPRRLLYLPAVLFMALAWALPLAPERKLRLLLLGFTVLTALALASLWVTVAWLFARVPKLVYDLSAWQATLLDVAYEALVTPLANKFIAPLLLAAGLGFLELGRAARASSAVPHPTPEKPKVQRARDSRRKQKAKRRSR